jgi:hypothetical protein
MMCHALSLLIIGFLIWTGRIDIIFLESMLSLSLFVLNIADAWTLTSQGHLSLTQIQIPS